MSSLHPDHVAIDRVGTRKIMDYFEISRQSVFYWRRAGVPKQYRKALAELGEKAGKPMTELTAPRGAAPTPPAPAGDVAGELPA